MKRLSFDKMQTMIPLANSRMKDEILTRWGCINRSLNRTGSGLARFCPYLATEEKFQWLDAMIDC